MLLLQKKTLRTYKSTVMSQGLPSKNLMLFGGFSGLDNSPFSHSLRIHATGASCNMLLHVVERKDAGKDHTDQPLIDFED